MTAVPIQDVAVVEYAFTPMVSRMLPRYSGQSREFWLLNCANAVNTYSSCLFIALCQKRATDPGILISNMIKSGGASPEVTLEDGLWSVLVGEAAETSAREGRVTDI